MLRENRRPSARQFLRIDGRFAMQQGALESPTIAYETIGTLNDRGDNAILILTGLSPSAHVCSSEADPSPGWWEEMVGPEKPIDTTRFFVVCVNSLGSCFGSTGSASIDPRTDAPYRMNFPVLHVEDIASAAHAVVTHLGITHLHAVVGASMGGMSALAYAIMYPHGVTSLVSISSATRSLPFSIALRSVQREMIRRDPAWKDGYYHPNRPPVNGMRLARKLGMITYRSAREWDQRFGRERATNASEAGDPFCIDFEVEAYLEAHADKFIGAFDANCYLYLSRAMDLFDVADHGGTIASGLARVQVERALVIGVDTDFLFPLHQQQELAHGLQQPGRQVTFHALPSIQGHDAFLVDMDRFRPAIASFFG